ncbi:uncharacterized protein LOC143923325 [Lithobates pipiens]
MEGSHGERTPKGKGVREDKGSHRKKDKHQKSPKNDQKVTTPPRPGEPKGSKTPELQKTGGTRDGDGTLQRRRKPDKTQSFRVLILSWEVSRNPIDIADLLKEDENIAHCWYVALSPPTKDVDWTLPVDQSSIVIIYTSPTSEKPLYEMERYLEYCVGKKGSDKVIVVSGESEKLDRKWISLWEKNPFAYIIKPILVSRADLDWITRKEILQEMREKLDKLKISLLGHTGHENNPTGKREQNTPERQTSKTPQPQLYEKIINKDHETLHEERAGANQTNYEEINLTVGFFSWSARTDSDWLQRLLSSQYFQITVIYTDVPNTDHEKVTKVISSASTPLLYFTEGTFRTFFSQPDTKVKTHFIPDKKKVIVVIDDLDGKSSEKGIRELYKKSSLGNRPSDLFLFRKEEKETDYLAHLKRDKLVNKQAEQRWNLFQDLIHDLVKLPSPPTPKLGTVGIFSGCPGTDYTWLQSLLKSPKLQALVDDVTTFHISDKGIEGIINCSFGVLYHRRSQGAVRIVENYDTEMEHLSAMLGRFNVLVIMDDVENSSWKEKERILYSQPRIRKFACNLLLLTKEEKKNEEKMLTKLREVLFGPGLPQTGPLEPPDMTEPQITGDDGGTSDTGNNPGVPIGVDNETESVDSAIADIAGSQGTSERQAAQDAMLQLPPVQFVPEEHIQIDKSCKLGVGSFGTVYKGSYQGTASAVKKLDLEDEDLNGIMHEIQVSMRLHHPHIVKLMAATKTDRHILLATEYIHGANLDRILHSPSCSIKLSEDDKMYVSLEIMLAVEYIHSQNIIHQDIKPVNILVEGKTKKTFLTDWGMANIRETVRNKVEKSKKIGPIGGTLLYKAPECVLEDQIPPTKMSDIWSVGATFLEVFTQKKPWTTCNGMLKNMFNKELPKTFDALTEKLQPIVKECFSYEPKERPTASRMVSAIKSMEGVDLVKHYGYTF